MTQYIIELIQSTRGREYQGLMPFLKELCMELERFDPRDFEPSVQARLVICRQHIRHVGEMGRSSGSFGNIEGTLDELVQILRHFRGIGAKGIQRSFGFIRENDLRNIIERDYSELRLKLFPSGAWKSTVIMAGSILEAILFDRLADPAWNALANASPKALDKKRQQDSRRKMESGKPDRYFDGHRTAPRGPRQHNPPCSSRLP
jgi:hypothetical protein